MSENEEIPVEELPKEELPTEPQPEPFPDVMEQPPSEKLLIFDNGKNTYEIGYWLNAESYPDSTEPYYIVDCGTEEGATMAAKIKQLHPYFTLDVVEGALVDVTQREKTQAEIDKENAPPPKTAEQIRVEQLESQLADVQLALAELFTI